MCGDFVLLFMELFLLCRSSKDGSVTNRAQLVNLQSFYLTDLQTFWIDNSFQFVPGFYQALLF